MTNAKGTDCTTNRVEASASHRRWAAVAGVGWAWAVTLIASRSRRRQLPGDPTVAAGLGHGGHSRGLAARRRGGRFGRRRMVILAKLPGLRRVPAGLQRFRRLRAAAGQYLARPRLLDGIAGAARVLRPFQSVVGAVGARFGGCCPTRGCSSFSRRCVWRRRRCACLVLPGVAHRSAGHLCLGTAYLTYPALGQLNLSYSYGWHPVSLAMCLMFAATAALAWGRRWTAMACTVVACGCRRTCW